VAVAVAAAGGFGSAAQVGAKTLEFGVGEDAALVQFRQFPERVGGVRTAGRNLLGVRRGPRAGCAAEATGWEDLEELRAPAPVASTADGGSR
jgi:hypothetical protein